ncbi:cellulase [Terrimicrobium sacchariphilum]|uniref:Cellulase n=1 Tax=Terrimicrobium sacchariphilum TaxID=690879 RepID=A0A146GFM6_TERSA|nr:glycoside hydrolase family 5 protein [Terrimicrobium sacchariphilum]GAT35417.1 cellulase [Terrimicrobium sacchariphilum]
MMTCSLRSFVRSCTQVRRLIPSAVLALTVGLSLSHAADTGIDLLKNGDLETDANSDQWPDDWSKAKVGGSWEAEEGNHFIRLKASEPDQMIMIYREIPIPAGAKALQLKFRARVSGLQIGTSSWFDARIMMDFLGADRQVVKPGPPAPSFRKDTEGWVDKDVTFLVPEGTKILKFMPTLFKVTAGTFDIDNLSLTVIDDTEVKAAAAAKQEEAQAKQTQKADARRAKAAANVQADGSLIANGNFEASKNNEWPDGWPHPKTGGSWPSEDGNHFLRLSSSTPGEMVMLYRELDLPAGVKALELKWRWRVTGLKKGAVPWNDARILFKLKDAAGKDIPNPPGPVYSQKDTDGWVEKTTSFLVPENAVSLVLMPAVFQAQAGTLDIDDFSIKPTAPEPLIAAKAAQEAADKKLYVAPEEPNKAKWPKELHVDGKKVLDSDGKEVLLQGVNAGGLETLATEKHIMRSALVGMEWGSNIIRLPVKEEFWFGRNPIQKDGGKAYRETVDNIVNLVANRGGYVLLDLHRFRAPKPEHVEFWKDAAEHYKNHPAVLFDLFNEPHDISWDVWKNGGFVEEKKGADESAFLSDEEKAKNSGFQSVGMQALLDAVRSTGAKNIVIVGGLGWSGDLSGIANGYTLDDKGGNGIIYGWHIYNWHKDWQGRVMAAAEKYPILVGEFGADEKKVNFLPVEIQEDPYTWVPDMLGFLQKNGFHWTAWCLHPKATPVLISDWEYTPTPFWGEFAKRALKGEKFEMKKMR